MFMTCATKPREKCVRSLAGSSLLDLVDLEAPSPSAKKMVPETLQSSASGCITRTMSVTWEMSGCGECPISLQDAQQLAIEAGFTFSTDSSLPLARRADLQG